MLRPLPLAIALRYLRVRRRSRFVSVVAAVAIAGVTLAVAALIVVLSVMNGMQGIIRGRILAVSTQVSIATQDGSALPDPVALAARTAKTSGVVASAPYAEREVVLGYGIALAGARLRGISPGEEGKVSSLGAHMVVGSLAALAGERYGIVLGRSLAVRLGVFPGDQVSVIMPHGLATPVGFVPRMRRFTVVGVFAAGLAREHALLAVTSLGAAERLFGIAGPSALRLRLAQPLQAGAVAANLRSGLSPGLVVDTWEGTHRSLFQALANEQRMLFILVALAILIAAFNVLGVLTVLVADKREEIATLASIGLSPRGIRASFLALGAMIGAIGIGLGLLIGLVLAFNVNAIVTGLGHLLGHPLFASGAVELAGLPSIVEPWQVVGISVIAAVLVLIAAWIPARRAARMTPVEALAGG
ncbi:MAG: FtsX-like permease family protein [Gammaproteobacteria bacterium]